tara:strand:- start:18504 stop:18959 length:456 start_codon:yes stop_codon:yes gene_type:complete
MVKKEDWGNAVWLLFHTIGEKIDEDFFKNNNTLIIDLIVLICSNLPCPDCANHAKETLKLANLNNIKSKDDLKKFFWTFHNIVNKKLKKQIITFEYLELYKRTIPFNVFKNFKNNYYNRPYNSKLLIDSFQFQKIKKIVDSKLDYILQYGF